MRGGRVSDGEGRGLGNGREGKGRRGRERRMRKNGRGRRGEIRGFLREEGKEGRRNGEEK